MANIFDRLQFVKHEEIFATREDAYNYVISKQIFERPSLVAEPMILLYESDDAVKGPNVILAIGSVGNGVDSSTDNRTFFIDTQKTEEEIEELRELIEQAIKSLTIIPVDSETLDISAEKTDEGTFLSGDVKIADYTIASGKVQNNIITVEEGKGLYAFVDMDYDPETFVITFNVNGVIKNFQLPPDQHVEKGWYSPADEALFLKLADDSKVKIDVVKLIDEWTVLSSASTTPIMLFKEHVSAYTEEHDGVYDWQDLLTADVRLADHISDNIIHKDRTGRFLYVKGTADNIKYKNNQTVAQALDSIDTRVSTSAGNMIYRRPDGLFASAMLDYNSAENKLIYRYTDTQTEDFKEVSFTLNSVKILQDITYDPVKEVIVIRYIDAQGEYQRVEIPAKDIIEEWIVNNEAHNIELVKYRSEGQGKDILSADAKIHAGDNNILEDKDHKLYVNGISDNIKYDVTGDTTVKGVLDELSGKTIATDVKLDAEIERAEAAEKELEDTIGSGFTSDPHENVTAKFEELSGKVDSEIERSTTKDEELEAAIATEESRATSAETVLDGRVDAIEDEIGEGFGPRNTVRDEIDNLQSEIDAVSADSASSLKDIINEDHSIDVDRTNPTKPVISVNLSTELEDDRKNIIKLNNDGLFANVDLDYIPEANKLILHKTDGEGDKEIQLESMSSIISIEYNPAKEAIVITYMTNGHEIKTVEIPVGDLINEWRVEDGHPHAVQLEKVRVASGTSEQDVLKASVIITDDHDDNILVMDDGALYVSGAQISANTAAIEAEAARATAAEQELDRKINQEISDRQADVDAEETRAKAAETALQNAITAEQERAENAENTLQTNINNEQARAEEAERTLQSNIESETVRATSAETALQTAINTEMSRAISAETRLEHLIEDEETARINGDSVLNNKIDSEITRATSTENRIETALNNEVSRAQVKEGELNTAITNETLRAQAADNELYQKIADESADRAAGDADLLSRINQEVSRAQVAENTISEALATETNNRINDVTNLTNALTAETQAREAKDAELGQMIEDATLTFEDTSSIDFTKTTGNVVTAKVKIANSNGNIILNPEGTAYEGLFASVRMDYDQVTNKIQLYVNDILQDEKLLSAGALLDSITYDSTNRALVLTYTDANGVQHSLNFPVNELFNEWHVENPSEKSAIELTKIPAAQPGSDDILSGRVLITDDHDGDGKPDEGSNNLIEIKNNGLYVDGSKLSGAVEDVQCVKNECKAFENAVIGHIIGEECGSGYSYEAHNTARYINTATSFANADYILDKTIGIVDDKVEEIIEDIDCVDAKADTIYKMLYTNAAPMPACGSGATYQPYVGACIISGATSFMEADQLLNDQICEILDMWVSGKTCTTESQWVDEGANKKMIVDVRLSRGNLAEQSDEDVIIETLSGPYIDPTRTEFTDTNALRIVCLTEGPSGTTPSVDSMQNGVYLSNVWDCGLYYDEATDADAIEAAQAAGYKTDNYRTDTNPDASNYNYMNNVRQTDIPHD